MAQKVCQSCGMPIGETEETFGTHADGSRNEDYCQYCYKDGAFTWEGTMDEMIEQCVPYMATPESGISQDEARKMLQQQMPTLTRWKQ